MAHLDPGLAMILLHLSDSIRQAICDALQRAYAAAHAYAGEAPPEQYAATLGYNRWLKVDAEIASILAPNALAHWRRIGGSGFSYAAIDVADKILLTAKSSPGGIKLAGDAVYRRELANSLNYQPTMFEEFDREPLGRVQIDRAYGVILHGNYLGSAATELPDFVAVAFPDYSFTKYLHVEHLVGRVAVDSVHADSLITTPVKEEVQRWLVSPKRSNAK